MIRHFFFSILLASPAFADGLKEGQIIDWPLPSFEEALRAFPANDEEGRPRINIFLRRKNNGHIVARQDETGFADDSVFGERQSYVLEPQDDGQLLVLKVRTEYSCYRGENPKTWQTGLCP